MIPELEDKTYTYNVAQPTTNTVLSNLFSRYGNAINAQYHSVDVITSIPYADIQASGTVIPEWFLFSGNNALHEFVISIKKKPKISLGQAHNIAMKAMADAEKRRERERELEAKFWGSLDGDE
jgi:hypothetical protein